MTQPSTQPSVRKLRHSVQKRAYAVLMILRGAPGATKEQQIQALDQSIDLLNQALEKAKQAREIVFMRDFDTYKEAKDAAKAQAETALVAKDTLPDGEEKSAEQLTFDEIIAKLNGGGDAPAKPTEDDQPPF